MNTTAERFVGDIMTRNVLTIHKDADLTDAIRTMAQECLSVLPVVDQSGKVCGILSTSDLIALTYDFQADISVLPHVSEVVRQTLIEAITEDSSSMDVSSVMTSNVKSVTPQDKLGDAARLLTENSIHHLPVVDESGKPLGILSSSDIVRSVAFLS